MDISKIGPGNVVYATHVVQITKLRGNENKPKTIKALVLAEKDHISSSDGEEWWIVWKAIDLETSMEFKLSSHNYDIELVS